jgi:hypothetical protein
MTSITNKLGLIEDRKILAELFNKCAGVSNPLILAKLNYKPRNQ